jgi:hypothetical protein
MNQPASDFPEFEKAYRSVLVKDLSDQFEQLAAEANFNVYHSDIWRGTGRRFAELIVKECIRLCDEVDLAGADDCIDKIRDHFGVK